MLKNSTRKVYIVNNFKSDKIEQAIFILKSGCEITGKVSGDLAFEAQRIIDDYVIKIESKKNKINKIKKPTNHYFSGLSGILLTLIAFGVLSYFIIMGITKIW